MKGTQVQEAHYALDWTMIVDVAMGHNNYGLSYNTSYAALWADLALSDPQVLNKAK